MQQDLLHRYLFDKLDVRGELVQIEHAYNEMIANHNYPEPVKALLGELLVATCLLTATLKYKAMALLNTLLLTATINKICVVLRACKARLAAQR